MRPNPLTSLMHLNPIQDGQFALPMPQQLVDTQNLRWQEENALIGAALDTLMNDGLQGMGGITTLAGMHAINTLGGAAGGMLAGAAGLNATDQSRAGASLGGALSSATRAILQNSGLAMNPVLSQMFHHPEFKRHQFSWKFAPKNSAESSLIRYIIDTIRFHSLPDMAAGGAFFKYPSIAHIKIHTGSKELYQFQPAVITETSINYAGAGVPSFRAVSKEPSIITMTLSFVEIILNTRLNNRFRNAAGGITPETESPLSLNLNPNVSGVGGLNMQQIIRNFL